MKTFISSSVALVLLLTIFSCKNRDRPQIQDSTKALLPELEKSLEELVQVWYPKTIDSVHGGFWSDFNFKWEKESKQHKMLVSQARHVWTTATLSMYYEDLAYEQMAQHGFEFLRDVMWDKAYGGFHTLFEIDNNGLKLVSKGKSAYGNSFAIYGLATYYKASKNTAALELAKKTFHWLENHSHDSIYGGYFDVMAQNGDWLLAQEEDPGYDNFIRKNWKDQNSSIHLLESFTALYEVWPNKLLKKRLQELLVLVRDTITSDKGYLYLHQERDWTPVSFRDSSETYRKDNFYLDHISFGHDVETAFLLLEASHPLKIINDSITRRKAKKMVDHALDWGWDHEKGGIYDGGYYHMDGTRKIENEAKVWWAEAEALNSLLLMAALFPEEKRYASLFKKQWEYISNNLIDTEYGGWYVEGLDTDPDAKTKAKAHIWKVNYHNIRSLINVIHMIKGDFQLISH